MCDISSSPSIFAIYGSIDALFLHPVVVYTPAGNICPLLFTPADRPLVWPGWPARQSGCYLRSVRMAAGLALLLLSLSLSLTAATPEEAALNRTKSSKESLETPE